MSDSRSEKRQITNKRNKHTSFGEVNNVRVELLRDSGRSVSVVRSALVAPEYTGKQFTCLLVDNCVKNCPQAVVEVDTKYYYKGRLPVVCMDRCIYDLILGNDIYEHTSERYEVKQSQAEGAKRIVDMIFENSKLRSGSPQLEVVCEKNFKPSVQNGGVIVNEQNAVKVDERSKDKVEEFYSAAVQTRAQKQVEITATSQSPHKDNIS